MLVNFQIYVYGITTYRSKTYQMHRKREEIEHINNGKKGNHKCDEHAGQVSNLCI